MVKVVKGKCPCGNDTDSRWILCPTCDQWLHLDCVGLNGLDEEGVESLTSWKCPKCLISPYPKVKPVLNDYNAVCTELKEVIKDEMKSAFEVLTSTVKKVTKDVVNEATPNVVSSVVEKTKTYAAAAEQNQMKLVEEVKKATTSNELVDKICKRMDNDNHERERRKSNVIVSNVPEPNGDLSPDEKKQADCVSLCKNLDMEMNEIVTCFRTGAVKKDRNGNPLPRPLVVKMRDVETANFWHDNGKGHKIGDSWINPDLCKVDREIQFFARVERRKKREEAAKRKAEKK